MGVSTVLRGRVKHVLPRCGLPLQREIKVEAGAEEFALSPALPPNLFFPRTSSHLALLYLSTTSFQEGAHYFGGDMCPRSGPFG